MANHTSPIDVIILASDGCYAMVFLRHCGGKKSILVHLIVVLKEKCFMLSVCFTLVQVGQIHGGLMGVIQRSMVKACPHVWFERSEVKDRHLVAKR